MALTRLMCTFRVERHLLGVDIGRVQEILRAQPLTRVPLAPAEVAGLLNLRGQIVPALELRQRLGLPPRPPGAEPHNVVLRSEEGSVSLLVDDIGDILEAPPSAYEPLPEHLRGPLRELLLGVYKLPTGLLLELSADAALTLPQP
jgi:purine-binding chemotaxis protein CheW